MASDSVNIAEDAEMAECDGDKVVTMMDVLQEQQDFEEDANAVLGASDDKNCTYSKGYIKRQALYACLTCCTEAKVDPTKRAGVCLACSLNCHENHELIELYTKRNFRCDCGNPKFNSNPCQFTSDKTELNDDNIYNQNFSGLYCTCQRPYPDPESTVEDDMIQCIICEDWLHASHLEAVVPANDQYSEMVCKNCMEKNDFLHDYSMFAVTVEAGDVDIVTVNGDAKSANISLCNGDSDKEKLVNGIEENKTEIETTSVTVNGDVEMNGDQEKRTENKKVDESVAAEINKETKLDDLSTLESSELKPEDTESKIAEQEPAKTDAPAEPEDSNNDKKQKETSEDTSDKSDDKSDATENTPIADPTQNNETSPDKTESTNKKSENAGSTNEKMESTENKPEKTVEMVKEQTETQEQISKQSKSEEDGDDDNAQEKTDTSEKTEQQLLDDLTALTGDNRTSEEKTDLSVEEKPETATVEKGTVENMEQSEDSKENHEVETKNIKTKEKSLEEMVKESGDKSEEKPVVENETTTGNIEVPDTSQSEKDAKENTKEKTDSVMDAIDELLQTANEAKEKESAEETKETTSESTESKEVTDNVETKESDVEMSASEYKLDNEVPENAEDTADSNDKPSTNTEDVEMSDTSIQNEPVSESKVDDPTTDSANKDVNDTEATKVNEVKLENESVEEKPRVSDTASDSELKASDDNDSTIKTEPSKDENEVPTVTENTKEHKRKLSIDLTDDMSSKKAKLECVRPKDVIKVHKGATFWPSNFRHKLCTCGECLSMYKDLKVLFLTDLEDTVFAYESLGKENVAGGASQYEKGMQALSSLDRIQQINALTEYNRMRDKLLDFLKSFKDRKEVVKEEDIKAFFAGMKPRREPDGVYFCR